MSDELEELKTKNNILKDAYRIAGELLDAKTKEAAMWRAAYWALVNKEKRND